MSPMQRAYQTELDLNHTQITACRQHAGAARWAYNWGLRRKQEAYRATGKSPSAMELHRELNALKATEVPWMYDVSKCAPQEALRNLDRAFDGFFRRAQAKRAGQHRGKVGYPKFKSKKRGLGSFRLTGSIVVFPQAIQLPRLGRLRLKERGYLPISGVRVLSATVSEWAGHWYVSVLVEREQPVVPPKIGPAVGVDLGLKVLATCSDGMVVENPRPLKRRLKKLKRLHRAVSHKVQGSQNRKHAVQRLAAAYRRVANQRAHTLHQLTSRLARTKAVVVIEDLNVAGLLRNHHLAQAIGDVGWGEFRRQLTYKAAWYGCRVVLAERWEPSSRACSACGWRDEALTLADRVFQCQNPACGQVMDRDSERGAQSRQIGQWNLTGREFLGQSKRRWRGERWLGSQGPGEIGLSEAGTRYVRGFGGKRQILENGKRRCQCSGERMGASQVSPLVTTKSAPGR